MREYINHLEKIFSDDTHTIVSFLIGQTEKRTLNILERKYISDFIKGIK